MKTKLILLGMTLFASVSAHAQTASDIDTQIKVTHDVVAKIIENLKAEPIESTLNMADYKAWKSEFDQKLEAEMIHFEKQVNEVILPSIRAGAQNYLKVKGATGLTAEQKNYIVDQEWSRVAADKRFDGMYHQAILSVYDALFPGLPMGISSEWVDLRTGRYDDPTVSRMIALDRKKVYYYGPSGNILKSISESSIRKNTGTRDGFQYTTYGYQKFIYPFLRQKCATRLCITFATQKLASAVSLIRELIDISKVIEIADSRITLTALGNYGYDPSPYHIDTEEELLKATRNGQVGLFKDVLGSQYFPEEYFQLPLDTQ